MDTSAANLAGIDVGSLSTDVVIINSRKETLGWAIVDTGASSTAAAGEALDLALEMAGLERSGLAKVVATGYGREAVEGADKTLTEISSHAPGDPICSFPRPGP